MIIANETSDTVLVQVEYYRQRVKPEPLVPELDVKLVRVDAGPDAAGRARAIVASTIAAYAARDCSWRFWLA